MSSLLKAYEAAKGIAAKKRPFEVAGEVIELPRLTLGNRAEFERWMRTKHDPPVAGFSLSAIRNRAMLAVADAVRAVKDKWIADGNPTDFTSMSDEERERTNNDLMERSVGSLTPYMEELFRPLDTSAIRQAVTLVMKQLGEEGVTDEIIADVIEATPSAVLDRMCLWVLGLEEWTEKVIERELPETLDDALNDTLGDPKNSATEPDGRSTTSKRSRSSRSPTEETLIGSGDSQKTSSPTGSMESKAGSGSTGS